MASADAPAGWTLPTIVWRPHGRPRASMSVMPLLAPGDVAEEAAAVGTSWPGAIAGLGGLDVLVNTIGGDDRHGGGIVAQVRTRGRGSKPKRRYEFETRAAKGLSLRGFWQPRSPRCRAPEFLWLAPPRCGRVTMHGGDGIGFARPATRSRQLARSRTTIYICSISFEHRMLGQWPPHDWARAVRPP